MFMVLCLFSATAQTPEVHTTILTQTNYPVKVTKIMDRIAPTEVAQRVMITKIAKLREITDSTPHKCWRTKANGHKSYRLRRVCRAGERLKP